MVLDLIMPAMSGFEFLKRLREISRGRRTPVLVCASKDVTGVERAKRRSSNSADTRKDDQAAELIHEIRHILRTSVGVTQHTEEMMIFTAATLEVACDGTAWNSNRRR
jgi:CheY-like chemotaxis protein